MEQFSGGGQKGSRSSPKGAQLGGSKGSLEMGRGTRSDRKCGPLPEGVPEKSTSREKEETGRGTRSKTRDQRLLFIMAEKKSRLQG